MCDQDPQWLKTPQRAGEPQQPEIPTWTPQGEAGKGSSCVTIPQVDNGGFIVVSSQNSYSCIFKLIIVLFICITTVDLFLPTPVYSVKSVQSFHGNYDN